MTAPDSRSMLHLARIRGEERGRVRRLPGFRKEAHFEPAHHSPAAADFVKQVGAPMVEERASLLHQTLRRSFGYKRRELDYQCEGGLALLRTPGFEVTVAIEQTPEAAREFRLRVEVGGFHGAEAWQDPAFAAVFGSLCDRIEIALPRPVDVAARIDALEENSALASYLEYPPDASRLAIRLPAPAVRLELSSDALCFRLPAGGDLRQLLSGTLALLEALAASGMEYLGEAPPT